MYRYELMGINNVKELTKQEKNIIEFINNLISDLEQIIISLKRLL